MIRVGESAPSRRRDVGGEARLGRALHHPLAGPSVVLSDRRVPETTIVIDHVVVAPSGVWVIDVEECRGRVERRDAGGWFDEDLRVRVGGHDCTPAIDRLGWQAEVVRKQLVQHGLHDVPIHPALCLTDAEWSLFDWPFNVRGVWVGWPKRLIADIAQAGQLNTPMIELVARQLAVSLPARMAS